MSSYNYSNNQSNIINTTIENKGLYSRILRNISSHGMDYTDMIVRNQVGVNINEDPYSSVNGTMYDFFSQRAVASVLNKKSLPYLDKAYADKRRILREYSIKDEIRDFISSIADESIVYNDESDFCSPKALSNEYPKEITDKYQECFEKIYNRHGFADSITAWALMKDFLIDGYLAMEIVYDDKKKEIIGFNRLRPETITVAHDPAIGIIWVQYAEDPQLRRIFLDSQMIFISYTTQNDYSETSYVEGLIKPYNQLKILEQTRIMFNVVNATIYQKFVIPIKGLPKHKAEEQIGQLIHDYSEEVEWDDTLGTLSINGSKHLNFNKQIWFPEGENGSPQMDIVQPQGHDLNDESMLNWFYKGLKRASKIPFGRFDADNGGGNLYSDSSEMTRDEIKFHNFISRLRAIFKELVVKPLKIQMLLEFPELKDDDIFKNQVDITFYSNQLFEDWKKINNLSKRSEIISTLLGVMNGDNPYFHIEYLMDKVFKLTPEEKAENERYWARDKTNMVGSTEGDMSSDDFGSDMGGNERPEGGMEEPIAGEAEGGMEEPPSPPSGDDTSAEPGGGEFEF